MVVKVISKKEAKSLGLNYYFTGKPCIKGHISTRFLSGGCSKCAELQRVEWRANNPDRVSIHNRKQREKDPIQLKQIRAQYYINYKESIKHKCATYRNINKSKIQCRGKQHSQRYRKLYSAKVNMFCSKRRAAKLLATPTWFETDLVQQMYNMRTKLSKEWKVSLVVDHIIPLHPKDNSVCGLHCWANLQILEQSINSIKSDKYQTDW